MQLICIPAVFGVGEYTYLQFENEFSGLAFNYRGKGNDIHGTNLLSPAGICGILPPLPDLEAHSAWDGQ